MLKVVVAYCNGSTQQQISTELGVHVQTICGTLGDTGVGLNERNAAFSDDELQTVRRLHADGTSAREFKLRHGVANTTIRRQSR